MRPASEWNDERSTVCSPIVLRTHREPMHVRERMVRRARGGGSRCGERGGEECGRPGTPGRR